MPSKEESDSPAIACVGWKATGMARRHRNHRGLTQVSLSLPTEMYKEYNTVVQYSRKAHEYVCCYDDPLLLFTTVLRKNDDEYT